MVKSKSILHFVDSDDLKAMHSKGVSVTRAFRDQHNQAKNWPSKADTQESSLALWTLGGCLSMGGMEGHHQRWVRALLGAKQ